MLKMHLLSPEHLLRVLQCLNRHPNQVKQIHSLLTTSGHLHITCKWINTLLFNTLIRAYLNISQHQTSIILFSHMLYHDAPPNNHTFPSVIKAASLLPLPHLVCAVGCSLHAQGVKRGIFYDPFVQTSLVVTYSQMGDLTSAYKMFDEISQPCIVSYNAMLDAFGKNGDMHSAISMFQGMPKRDVYSWTCIINGFAKNGFFKESIGFFRQMMFDEDAMSGFLKPSEATFVSVLSSCMNLDTTSTLYQGKQIHGYTVRNEKTLSVLSGTALIAFYGKIGCLSYAMKVFNAMVIKEVCAWNAMICSLASNGKERQALDMFEEMKSCGLHPNEVTFVGVLSACARASLVDLGLELFRSMTHEFAVTPRMEHYGCLVDLLGRAGLLKEAYAFVRSMPFGADATVLGALLAACKVHGAIELAKEVGRQLLELRPHHCGQYVLLSSIYAGAGRWDHAAALRKTMVDANIQKVPAFSMINHT